VPFQIISPDENDDDEVRLPPERLEVRVLVFALVDNARQAEYLCESIERALRLRGITPNVVRVDIAPESGPTVN
jgi:hypothetical protein